MLILQVTACCFALLLVGGVLWDAFETIVLPRRVSRKVGLTRGCTRAAWFVWSGSARRIQPVARRESFLAVFGPLALLGLLLLWVVLLIVGFALLQWGLGSHFADQSGAVSFGTDLYFSGTTLLTLGLGDVVPRTVLTRVVTLIEVGTGFGMLAMVIGYLPVLYQAFSRREVRISLLDAHAGSPPTAGALLLRHPPGQRPSQLISILAEGERWSAELLESQISFPFLVFYRSQHEEQSWISALTMFLDACALVLAGATEHVQDEGLLEQAAFTFAMARHAAADLAQSLGMPARAFCLPERLTAARRARLADTLIALHPVRDPETAASTVEREVDALRRLYEPHVAWLGAFLLMDLPPWMPAPGALDNWQVTAQHLTAPPIATLGFRSSGGERRPSSEGVHMAPSPAPGGITNTTRDRGNARIES